jgi:hypothetical protein
MFKLGIEIRGLQFDVKKLYKFEAEFKLTLSQYFKISVVVLLGSSCYVNLSRQ